MKKDLHLNKKMILSIMITFFLSLFLIGILWNFKSLSINIPISYYGGDDYAALKNAKSIMDTGWVMENEYLGAPFGTEFYGYPSTATSNIDNFFLKILILLTKDISISVNLQFIFTFPLISVISYLVMRSLKINNIISILASLTYAFMPYIFLRGMSHTILSSYQFVPLSILLCLWMFEDDNFFIMNRNFFKNRKNMKAIFMTFLIANNGIAYYPFFTCFFLGITGLIKTVNKKHIKYLYRSLTLILSIVAFFVLALLPIIVHKLGDSDIIAFTTRSRVDAEVYGLKIFQLFLPVNSHNIDILSKLINYYNNNAPLVNENSCAYLGIAGALGFVLLLVLLFIKNSKNNQFNKLKFLSELNIVAVLLGTIGGFGSIIAVLITPMIRAYNRISIFIAYISILTLAIIFNEIKEKVKKIHVYFSIITLSFIFSILEQFPGNVPNYDYVKETYLSDKNFVKSIEKIVPSDALIFQLPYHAYPESGPVNSMSDYHLLSPYLHSNTLKWSYGGVKGSISDLWNKKVASMTTKDMIKTISVAGFEGIYIDKRAYTEEEYNKLDTEISKIVNAEVIYSDNDNLAFFDIQNFTNIYKKLYSDTEWNNLKEKIMNMNFVTFKTGFSVIEGEIPNQWIWLSNYAELNIINTSDENVKYELKFHISSSTMQDSNLELSIIDDFKFYKINLEGININENIILKPGINKIKIKSDAPKVYAPNDPRDLYLKITNFIFDDSISYK